MRIAKHIGTLSESRWVRIPDGIGVRHRSEAYDGVIDGLTEIVSGTDRNPDGKTQYRVKIGNSTRILVSENHLNILIDKNDLVVVRRESERYRQYTTDRLRSVFAPDRFVEIARTGPGSPRERT